MPYSIYILASKSRALYTGVTKDLRRHLWQHRTGVFAGHTRKYRLNRLVYFESSESVHAAIAREKQIKAWTRAKRVALIEAANPAWSDLAGEWLNQS
ncbi:MAG: GIY-YIG nuclease family protein [Gemmatirosa sp.]